MKEIKVLIERGDDGNFGAYMPDDNNLPFGAIGEGASAREAKADFLAVIESYKDEFEEVISKLDFRFLELV